MNRLLLISGGHTHAQMPRDWIGAPLPGVDLVLVSPSAQAPYSGMVPGWLAGVYGYNDICIDVKALARAARARLIIDMLAGLDADCRGVRLAIGTQLGYELLSLNVGLTLNPPAPCSHTRVLALHLLGSLREAWEGLLGELARCPSDQALTVTAVGGGVGTLLALLARLRSPQTLRTVLGMLIFRSATLLPDLAASASDLLLWAAGAKAHVWQRNCDLTVKNASRGFRHRSEAPCQTTTNRATLAPCTTFTNRRR